jgi:hypothetical protein
MAWWHDLSTIVLLVCPLVALLTGLTSGFASRNWGLGLLTGAATILIPLLTFETDIQFLVYAPIYSLIGFLGSILGWGVGKFYTHHKLPFG